MYSTREERIAKVQQDCEALRNTEHVTPLEPRKRRRVSGPSTVFSVRLDSFEFAALEARAAARGIKTSVLARNLIRAGLAAQHGDAVAQAVDQVEAALDELRALVP